jgi:hypothetical protein
MRVAASDVPAAECTRPAGTKPFSSACRKRASHAARSPAGSASASARATRRRTSAALFSSPLAYFSSSTSSLIAWAGKGRVVVIEALMAQGTAFRGATRYSGHGRAAHPGDLRRGAGGTP